MGMFRDVVLAVRGVGVFSEVLLLSFLLLLLLLILMLMLMFLLFLLFLFLLPRGHMACETTVLT